MYVKLHTVALFGVSWLEYTVALQHYKKLWGKKSGRMLYNDGGQRSVAAR